MTTLSQDVWQEVLDKYAEDSGLQAKDWSPLAKTSKTLFELAVPRLYSKISGKQLNSDAFARTLQEKPERARLIKQITWELLFDICVVIGSPPSVTNAYYCPTTQTARFDRQIQLINRFTNLQSLKCQLWVKRVPASSITPSYIYGSYSFVKLVEALQVSPPSVSCSIPIHMSDNDPMWNTDLSLTLSSWNLIDSWKEHTGMKHLVLDIGDRMVRKHDTNPDFSLCQKGVWPGVESLSLSTYQMEEGNAVEMGALVKDFANLKNLQISYMDPTISVDDGEGFTSLAQSFQYTLYDSDDVLLPQAAQLTTLKLSAISLDASSLPDNLASIMPSLQVLSLDFLRNDFEEDEPVAESLLSLFEALFPAALVCQSLRQISITCRLPYDEIIDDHSVECHDLLSIFTSKSVFPLLNEFEFNTEWGTSNIVFQPLAPWLRQINRRCLDDLQELMKDASENLLVTYGYLPRFAGGDGMKLKCRGGEQAESFTLAKL